MENNKNSDLEKKEGRIDDLLRVLICTALLVILMGLRMCLLSAPGCLYPRHIKIYSLLLSNQIQIYFVPNFSACPFISRQTVT